MANVRIRIGPKAPPFSVQLDGVFPVFLLVRWDNIRRAILRLESTGMLTQAETDHAWRRLMKEINGARKL